MKLDVKSFIIGIVIGAALIALLDNRYDTGMKHFGKRMYNMKLDRWTGRSWIYNQGEKIWIPIADFTERKMNVEAMKNQRAVKKMQKEQVNTN